MVANPNSLSARDCLFCFSSRCLRTPEQDGLWWNLTRVLAAKEGRHISEAMGALLAPRQLGYGIPQGAEATVHAARLYLNNLQLCQVILKLDFRNAFSSIHRDKMLCVVGKRTAELVPFVFSAYSKPSSLF